MPRVKAAEKVKDKKRKMIADGWKLIKSGEQYVPGRPSSYGYWNEGGKLFPSINFTHSCHAGLSSMKNAEILFSYTPQPKEHVNDPRFIEYMKWLITSSPWAMNKVIPKTSVTMAVKHGFLITNTGLPANLIANFLVATRQPFEAWFLIERWHEFCEQGIDPNTAFVFAEALGAGRWWKNGENNHEPLDIHVISKQAVENFVHGKMTNPLQPFKKDPNYQPCAGLWEYPGYSKYTADLKTMYKYFLDKEYPKTVDPNKSVSRRLFAVPVNDGREQARLPDGNGSSSNWVNSLLERSKEQWTEIALSESKRIHDVARAA